MKMQQQHRKSAIALTLAFAMGAGATAAPWSKIFKVGGAIVIADKLGPQIDKALSLATGQKKLSGQDIATKVVPVLSLGKGGAIGIVQVSGTQDAVDRTQAVAQIETDFKIVGKVRAKILIPIDSRSLSNIKRVPGVGVSALIDINL